MFPDHLLNQTITLYENTSFDREGREVVSSTGTEVSARIQATTKQKLNPNGSVTTIHAIAYVPNDTTVEIGYKVVWDSVTYKVYGKYGTPGYNGTINHYKLELIRWLMSN